MALTIQELQKKFEGQWVRKSSFMPFICRHDELYPVILVSTIGYRSGVPDRMSLYRREKGFEYYSFREEMAHEIPIENIQIISEEEARSILKIFNECTKLSECSRKEFSHIREDTGIEKVQYTEKTFTVPLFRLKMKYPDKEFNAYVCDVCGSIHIGKIQ